MERPDVEEMLDILAENHEEQWSYHKEDECYIYIYNKKFKGKPHIRIRKDTGMLECLDGIKFYKDGKKTGLWRMTCEEFVKLVRGKKDNGQHSITH